MFSNPQKLGRASKHDLPSISAVIVGADGNPPAPDNIDISSKCSARVRGQNPPSKIENVKPHCHPAAQRRDLLKHPKTIPSATHNVKHVVILKVSAET